MSEEAENHNDGTWSGLKKTIIGTLSTAVLGAGTWLTTTFFNPQSDSKEETKTEQVAPAPAAAPVVINLSNNNEQKQSAAPATTTIITSCIQIKNFITTPIIKVIIYARNFIQTSKIIHSIFTCSTYNIPINTTITSN
jgi:hypothetical protein